LPVHPLDLQLGVLPEMPPLSSPPDSPAADVAPPAAGEKLHPSVPLGRYSRAQVMPAVRRLSKVNNWRTAGYIALHWTVILGCVWAALASGHWLVYVVAGVVIGTRLQALGVMLHDGTHWLLFSNRTVNDVCSDLFLAFPLGLSTELYRATHFRHHRFTNTDDDPDLVIQREDHDWFDWPKSRLGCVWVLLKSLLGLNMLKAAPFYKQWSPWYNFFNRRCALSQRTRWLLVLSTAAVYAGVVATGKPLQILLLFLIPSITVLNLVNRIRATAEHLETPGDHELNATRTVLPTWWERLVIAPLGVNYHLEHHLFPSVPGPNLGKLHRLLMEDEEFRSRAHLTRSYVGVIGELMRCCARSAGDPQVEDVPSGKAAG